MSDNYTAEQRAARGEVRNAVMTLIAYENLEKQAHKPQLGIQGYLDASGADLQLEQFPPYDIMEQRLRARIIEARNLGLGDDSLVKICGELAGV